MDEKKQYIKHMNGGSIASALLPLAPYVLRVGTSSALNLLKNSLHLGVSVSQVPEQYRENYTKEYVKRMFGVNQLLFVPLEMALISKAQEKIHRQEYNLLRNMRP